MEVKGIVNDVTRFMSHNSQAILLSASFDDEHLLAFKSGQPGMRQVKRDSEAWDFIRCEPLFG
jgi:hypothetical protein